MTKHKFTTGDRLTHPTWKYKTRDSYLRSKQKEIVNCQQLVSKLLQGSAWLPKKVRKSIDVIESELDESYFFLSGFRTRLIKRSKR